jgi:predicted HTH transcriptional regulator
MKISVEEFLRGGDSKPRNNTIVTLFRRVGLCERAGSGEPKIFQAAQKNKLKLPDVKNETYKTIIKLWKIDIADAHPGLGDNEKKILRLLQKSMLPISSSEIRDKLNLTKYYSDQAIKTLIDNKLIEQDGNVFCKRKVQKIAEKKYRTLLTLFFYSFLVDNAFVNR